MPERVAKRWRGIDPLTRYVEADHGFSSPCWEWQGAIAHGYGAMWWDGKVRRAHRVFYEQHVAPIAPGRSIDHLCKNTACVNPDHLEPVTQRVNARRGTGVTLNAGDVEVLRRRAEGMPIWTASRLLAPEYGVSASAVYDALAYRTWNLDAA